MNEQNIKFGTCSWNYDSWAGLVYPGTVSRSVEYLPFYAEKYGTAEIDSWFYHIPGEQEVREYKEAVPDSFRFTCKVPQQITLTHHRKKNKDGSMNANSDFLSVSLFEGFIRVIEPLLPQIDALMFEFEYLNKKKMPGLTDFTACFEAFYKQLPAGLPYAVETRNGNYIKAPYFDFISRNGLVHVFSEKIYMPHIYDVYREYGEKIHSSNRRSVIRLLGGDRKEMEKKTKERWDAIVEPKEDLEQIAGMIRDLSGTLEVTVNVNNHYEGSAPKTIDRLSLLLR
jgi:uncharacterized protein YecE (DUF72 family)